MQASDTAKSSPTLDWSAVGAHYAAHGLLTPAQFEQLAEDTLKVHAEGLAGPSWGLVHMVLSAHRHIPLVEHYTALAAGYGFAFKGVEDFHLRAIELKTMPAWTLNQTRFSVSPPPSLPIGELMVQLGLIRSVDVEACLEAQRAIEKATSTRVALGCIVLSRFPVSFPDFYQTLGIQAERPYVSLDASAALIFDELGRKLRAKGRG